ncbi:hypothetical protein [uncultured Roseovarius sp.]|uniref:hypothetical protein n=1 Tax=uncultured Roseovarius sp. TaxID=293344 RepID=UPI00263885DF|nr:hypothetical protein [uncultured Roseovarius sp.]
MNTIPPKLTTALACRVARLDRDRFNEAVASGVFTCAPETIAGRARVFDPDDMVALFLYRELIEDGYSKTRAGKVACAVGQAARKYPDAKAISYVEDYFKGFGQAFPADRIPSFEEWDSTTFSGTDIRKVTTFRIGKMRDIIARDTAEETSIFGPED